MSTENTGSRRNHRRKGKSKATVNDPAPESVGADPRGTSSPPDAFYDAQNLSEDYDKVTDSIAEASLEKLESDIDFDEFQMATDVPPKASGESCEKKSKEQVIAEMEKLVTIPNDLPPLPDFNQCMEKIKDEVQTIYERYTPGSRLKAARTASKGLPQLKHYLKELRQELPTKSPAGQ